MYYSFFGYFKKGGSPNIYNSKSEHITYCTDIIFVEQLFLVNFTPKKRQSILKIDLSIFYRVFHFGSLVLEI